MAIRFCAVHTMVKSEIATMDEDLTQRAKAGRSHNRSAFKRIEIMWNPGVELQK